MKARRGLRKSYHCLHCAKEMMQPKRAGFGRTSFLVCPFCGEVKIFWGTREAFLRRCAKLGIDGASEEVGKMVGKAIAHSRN